MLSPKPTANTGAAAAGSLGFDSTWNLEGPAMDAEITTAIVMPMLNVAATKSIGIREIALPKSSEV